MSTIWIETFTGTKFDLLDTEEDDIHISDIAHALSNICRFCGHTKSFYSVAQHSVLVSDLLPDSLKLVGLLHDATEAYLHDITKPLKSVLSDYREIEKKLQYVISNKFCLPRGGFPQSVKIADHTALLIEKRDMTFSDKTWDHPYSSISISNIDTIVPQLPAEAKCQFLHLFKSLYKESF